MSITHTEAFATGSSFDDHANLAGSTSCNRSRDSRLEPTTSDFGARASMNLLATVILSGLLATTGASAQQLSGQGGPCDNNPGRDGGQDRCSAGLVCTGPFEGMYGRGNCQRPGGASARGFELFWDGKKVNGPDALDYSQNQARDACDKNRRPGIKIECRFNGVTFYKE